MRGRSFSCPIRQVARQEVFDVKKLPLQEYADSLGLAGSPQLHFKGKEEPRVDENGEVQVKKSKLANLKEKIKAKKEAKQALLESAPEDDLIRMKRRNISLSEAGLEALSDRPEKRPKLQKPAFGREVTDPGSLPDLTQALVAKVQSTKSADKESEKQRVKEKRQRKKQRAKEALLD